MTLFLLNTIWAQGESFRIEKVISFSSLWSREKVQAEPDDRQDPSNCVGERDERGKKEGEGETHEREEEQEEEEEKEKEKIINW